MQAKGGKCICRAWLWGGAGNQTPLACTPWAWLAQKQRTKRTLKHWLWHSLLDFHPPIQDHTQTIKFGRTNTNFKIEAQISTWRVSVNDFKKMNNKSYIRIILSNLVVLLARANLLVTQYNGDTHNARTLIPMNTRTQTLPLGASSKTVLANPQDASLSTGMTPTTESTDAIKSWEIRSHGEWNPGPEVLPGLL
jgi:hypothetical protein